MLELAWPATCPLALMLVARVLLAVDSAPMSWKKAIKPDSITSFEDGKSFELESTALPMTRMAIRATVVPTGGGTRVTQGFEPRGLLAPIAGPMMGGMILKTFSSVLAGLAQRVENT